MTVGTYDPRKVSIEIDGHELTEAGTFRAVSSGVIITGLSFSMTMTIAVTHEVHTINGVKHRHERLGGGRLGPAIHFEKTNMSDNDA
jgi:hypothetical protein